MKWVLFFFRNYFSFSIILAFVFLVLMVIFVFLFQIQKTDIALLNELQHLIEQQQHGVVSIPQTWQLVAHAECFKHVSSTISFVSGSLFMREIYYYYSLYNLDFCVTYQMPIMWSVFEYVFCLIALLCCVCVLYVFYIVLRMYVVSGIWKYISKIQIALYSEDVSPKISHFIRRLIMYLEVAPMKKTQSLRYELIDVLRGLLLDMEVRIEKKKIPEEVLREFNILQAFYRNITE